jgi:hypothetical protein
MEMTADRGIARVEEVEVDKRENAISGGRSGGHER